MANVNNGTLLIEVANHNYTVEIVNKVANLTVALPIGNYTAKAYFIEDDKYNAKPGDVLMYDWSASSNNYTKTDPISQSNKKNFRPPRAIP